MKLRISIKTLNTIVSPLQITTTDMLSIIPRIEVGQFKCCALNLTYNKVIIITHGIALLYNNISDFFSGLEPISLVEDNTIYYDQESGVIDFKIIPDTKQEVDTEAFGVIQNLMFGAREEATTPLDDTPIENEL